MAFMEPSNGSYDQLRTEFRADPNLDEVRPMRIKKMQVILFIVAASCGLAAAYGVTRNSGDTVVVAEEKAKIYVAKKDIIIGHELSEENIVLAEWPRNQIPAGTMSDIEELKERFARTSLFAGEPILESKLMDSNGGGKSARIPAGYRVVSVRVTVYSSVSGLVQPGDRVDLLVFLRKNEEIPTTATKTILQDVTVFAVDAETERSVDPAGDARSVRTVSLLVQPEQAETILLAGQLGELSLALRRPNDHLEGPSDGQTVQMLAGIEETEEIVNPIEEPAIVNPPVEKAKPIVTRRRSTGRILAIRGL
jgi:pilus assembly protein CpaB